MFDMLDCCILYMCLLLFVYCILCTCFVGSPTREADKIDFFKKILNVAPGSTWAYVAYVRQPSGTDKRKGLRFIGSTWPTNVS
jgi:hypothetical protein